MPQEIGKLTPFGNLFVLPDRKKIFKNVFVVLYEQFLHYVSFSRISEFLRHQSFLQETVRLASKVWGITNL